MKEAFLKVYTFPHELLTCLKLFNIGWIILNHLNKVFAVPWTSTGGFKVFSKSQSVVSESRNMQWFWKVLQNENIPNKNVIYKREKLKSKLFTQNFHHQTNANYATVATLLNLSTLCVWVASCNSSIDLQIVLDQWAID